MANGDDNQKYGATQSSSVFTKFARFFTQGGSTNNLRESLEEVIEEHDDDDGHNALGNDERSMLLNVLKYGELRTDDIMVPRVDIIAAEINTSFEKLINIFAEASHSRLPVYNENLDEVVGMVHVKDLIIHFNKSPDEMASGKIRDIMRPVLFVAPSMKLLDLLAKMRARRTHMAIVVDEYGGTDGLVTIEDLVEQIVGDIEDEHDVEGEELKLIPAAAGVFDVNARFALEELERVFDCDLLPEDKDEDIDTIGGLVASLAGRVLEIGESVEHAAGFRFEVLDGDPRHIKKIRLYVQDNVESDSSDRSDP